MQMVQGLNDHGSHGQKETTETPLHLTNATPPNASDVLPLPLTETFPSLDIDFNATIGGDAYRRKPPDRTPGPQKTPPDPYTLNHIVPFPYFCEWYKQTNARTLRQNTEPTPDELQDSFIKYREDLLARTAKDFCKEHANEAWFREKYDPVLRVQTRGKLVEYRRWLYARFMEDLEAGKFDEVTLDGAAARRYFAENGGGGGEVSPGSKKEGDIGEEDALTTCSALARMPSDPMADKRTPCIKTINTTVTRTQLEAVSPLNTLARQTNVLCMRLTRFLVARRYRGLPLPLHQRPQPN